MPFDYEEYFEKCSTLTEAALHKQWEKYTRHISSGSTSTVLSVAFAPFTGGMSLTGLGVAGPRIHNARRKRAIIEIHLKALSSTHNTRKRDVLGPMAMTSTIGVATFGLVSGVEDAVLGTGAEAGVGAIAYVTVTHVAIDEAGARAQHAYAKSTDERESEKLEKDQAMARRQFEQWKLQDEQLGIEERKS